MNPDATIPIAWMWTCRGIVFIVCLLCIAGLMILFGEDKPEQ